MVPSPLTFREKTALRWEAGCLGETSREGNTRVIPESREADSSGTLSGVEHAVLAVGHHLDREDLSEGPN
jgi:hypothetical protein